MSNAWIENHCGRLRIRFRHHGKTRTVSLGIEDGKAQRGYATSILGQVKLDLSLNQVDETLMRYKPRSVGTRATEISCPELFERYTRSKVLSEGSLTKYRGLTTHLQQHLNKPAYRVGVADALNFRSLLLGKVAERTAREYIWMLQSTFDWGQGKYAMPTENPFQGLSKTIKPQPRARIEPFTADEIWLILEGFKEDLHYSFYADVVHFLFFAGVRPGEAFGLRWRNVSKDFRSVKICEGAAKGKARQSTKTGRERIVHLCDSTSEMLRNRHSRLNSAPDSLVFPAPKGGIISDHTFRRRAWKSVLEKVGIDYRKLYTTRHSAASHAFDRGENPAAIAEQLGHSTAMFLSTYCHGVEKKAVLGGLL